MLMTELGISMLVKLVHNPYLQLIVHQLVLVETVEKY